MERSPIKKDPKLLIPFSFLYLHGNPKKRGSAWCSQVELKSVYHRLGIPLVPFAENVEWGIKTFEYFFLEDYEKAYPSFFASKESPKQMEKISP